MDDLQNDILISAYLDGELTADERERVEQLLATSAEARQLVDELRALRAGLQELPQHRLEIDFAQRVLSRAERETHEASTLTSAPFSPQRVTNDQSEMEQAETSPTIRIPRIWNARGIGWSLVAVAAAVLILVTNRPEPEQQVARQLDDQVLARGQAKNEGIVARDAGADGAPMPDATRFARSEPAVEPSSAARRGVTNGMSPAQAPAAPLTTENAVESRANAGDLAKSGESRFGEAKAPGLSATDPSATNPLAARPSAANPMGTVSSTPVPPGTVSSSGIAADDSTKLGADRSSDVAVGERGSIAQSVEQLHFANLPADLLVVQVEMSPEAAQRGEFDRLLAENRIVLGDEELRRREPLSGGVRLQEREADAPSDTISELKRMPALQKSSEVELKLRLEKDKSTVTDDAKALLEFAAPPASGPAAAYDYVYVEASPQQIDATLAKLRDAPRSYFSVAVADSRADDRNEKKENVGELSDRLAPMPLAQQDRADGLEGGQLGRRGGARGGGGGGFGGAVPSEGGGGFGGGGGRGRGARGGRGAGGAGQVAGGAQGSGASQGSGAGPGGVVGQGGLGAAGSQSGSQLKDLSKGEVADEASRPQSASGRGLAAGSESNAKSSADEKEVVEEQGAVNRRSRLAQDSSDMYGRALRLQVRTVPKGASSPLSASEAEKVAPQKGISAAPRLDGVDGRQSGQLSGGGSENAAAPAPTKVPAPAAGVPAAGEKVESSSRPAERPPLSVPAENRPTAGAASRDAGGVSAKQGQATPSRERGRSANEVLGLSSASAMPRQRALFILRIVDARDAKSVAPQPPPAAAVPPAPSAKPE